jgi:hypothetical protein
MKHRTGLDRSQTLLFHEWLEDYIGPENPVRFLHAFATSLDLRALGFAALLMFRTTTRIPPIIHPKMNAGKEPFKCGMASAECGVRPNFISVIAQPRACAPRPVAPAAFAPHSALR